ncbi:hypothetical protein BOX15_Mlig028594g1, partial [Macrostomum lignano]
CRTEMSNSSAAAPAELLKFVGCSEFRSRIALSILTGKPVKISSIRAKLENPGVREFEISYLRLIEQITNGTMVRISETGTVVLVRPGILTGGEFEFDCCAERGIGYYLEPLMLLGPFGKRSLSVKLTGVSNNSMDPSVEAVSYSCLPLLRRFLGRDSGSELSLERRGCHPVGGAEVRFQCPTVSKLKPLDLTQPGKIHRIRGMSFTCKVSPGMNGRQIVSAKELLRRLVPDVLLTADHCTGARGGQSPGFGVTLVAETRDGCRYVAECMSRPSGVAVAEASVPEDVGLTAAQLLCEEIYRGGCVDSISQPLALALMALCDRDASRLLTGPLTPHSVRLLRLLRQFLGVTFRLQSRPAGDDGLGGDKVLCTCVGSGFANLSKLVR